jgi:catechol 2,3-dioxygenase-like lactoylglutathione lyase family enzyme
MRRIVTLFVTGLLLASCHVEQMPPAGTDSTPAEAGITPARSVTMTDRHFLGLRTATYTVADLAAAKAWYTEATGVEPSFDEPYYVGFSVGGFELGLMPGEVERGDGGIAYWGVVNADSAYQRLIGLGATEHTPIADHGVRIGAVRDPFGNILGVVEWPEFEVKP